ncbi:MAG: glycosyltransferase, partial [Lachnospiraceae bacterium]|nr:glycosyltransferase [Lachnospiraceae bacterium]
MLTKILRKTRLNRLVFQFLKPFAINNTTLPEITLAQGLLEDFSTDPRNSCYYESTNNLCGDILYDLDIIVPCYNVEKYIRVCLESILKRETKFSYRIIAVDDGSTDCTGNILDEYKNRGEILVIHQKNQGFSGARNTGLNFVNSQYVMFIDSDDYLPEGAIERMMVCAFQLGADIVQGAYTNIDEQGKQYSFDRQTG